MKYTFLKQNRFRIMLCEGHRYSRYMTIYNKEYWRCTDRNCKGKIHLSAGRMVYNNHGHNHGPDHRGISGQMALGVMRERLQDKVGTPIRTVYERTVKEFEEVGHGPMRETLPYRTAVFEITGQFGEYGEWEQEPSEMGAAFEEGIIDTDEISDPLMFTAGGDDAQLDFASHTISEPLQELHCLSSAIGTDTIQSQPSPSNVSVASGSTVRDNRQTDLTIHNSYSLQTIPRSNAKHAIASVSKVMLDGGTNAHRENAQRSNNALHVKLQYPVKSAVPKIQMISPRAIVQNQSKLAKAAISPASSQHGADSDRRALQELQMKHARKEHALRLEQLAERHDAEMALVGLQQELAREKLQEFRQTQIKRE